MYLRQNTEISGAMTDDKSAKMSIVEAHEKLGHANESDTRKAAKELGIEIVQGAMPPCKVYTAGKDKQKNVPKSSEHVKATRDANRLFLDIAIIKKINGMPNVTKPNWRIMVDERTGLKFTDF